MARVEVSARAIENLTRLIETHSLPADTRQRVQRALRPLRRFPRVGAPLDGRWEGFCFLLGPWQWMVVVYVYLEDEDRVVVVTIQDGRTGRSPTAGSAK